MTDEAEVERPRDRRLSTSEFLDMIILTTRVKDAVERFSKGGWASREKYPARFPDLVRRMLASPHRYHSAIIDGIEVNGGTVAGHAMVTFQEGDVQVTVVGSEDEPDRGCGLQSISASASQVRDMIDRVIVAWNLDAFKPNLKATIA